MDQKESIMVDSLQEVSDHWSEIEPGSIENGG